MEILSKKPLKKMLAFTTSLAIAPKQFMISIGDELKKYCDFY